MIRNVTFVVQEPFDVVALAYGTGELRIEAGTPLTTDDRRLIGVLDAHPHLSRDDAPAADAPAADDDTKSEEE